MFTLGMASTMNRGRSTRHVGAKCGVYSIKCTEGMYIGASNDVANRYAHHRYALRRNIHKCKTLQNLWNSLGEDSFSFEIVKECDPSELDHWEQIHLESTSILLNTSKFVSGKCSRSSETRMKISRVQSGHTRSCGEQNPSAKLTEEVVTEIRSRKGTMRNRELAAQYGIAISTLEKILARKLWRHSA